MRQGEKKRLVLLNYYASQFRTYMNTNEFILNFFFFFFFFFF